MIAHENFDPWNHKYILLLIYSFCSLSKMDENLTKWHEHWKELPNKLVEQYD